MPSLFAYSLVCSIIFWNFLHILLYVCLEMKILLQNCKLNLSNSFHSRTLDTSILLWNQNLYEVVPVFYSQGNSQPFNLYPDFWKLRSWEIKVFFKPEKNFRFCKPKFFFQVFTLKKSWVYTIDLKKIQVWRNWNFSRVLKRPWFLKT